MYNFDSVIKKAEQQNRKDLVNDIFRLQVDYDLGYITLSDLKNAIKEINSILIPKFADRELKPKKKNKPDYQLKSICLESGQYNINKMLNLLLYRLNNGFIGYDTFQAKYNELKRHQESSLVHECEKMLKADYSRRCRLKERITNLIYSGTCQFITLTFTDDVLSSTTALVRRKYVQRFLKSISSGYVANIDFGKDFGREHYHAVVQIDYYNCDWWKYGYSFSEVIYNVSSEDKLASYITKLTNHAIKETCKRNHLIYSRGA